MKFVILVLTLIILLTGTAFSGDLYEVFINSNADAELLIFIKAEPLLQIDGGYLVLLDQQYLSKLQESTLEYNFIQSNISKEEIYIDGRKDKYNLERFSPLYIYDNTRLFKLDAQNLSLNKDHVQIFPLRNDYLEIKYFPPSCAWNSSCAR